MANPEVKNLTLPASVATGIATAQAVAGAGNLTLNGALASAGVANLVTAQRVGIVSANAGDTTQTAAITGTDRYGNTISETVNLNGTTKVNTLQDFLTVTKIAISAATAGNISAGTVGIGSSDWILNNIYITPCQVSLALQLVSGAGTASAEYTYDDPNAPAGGYTAYPGADSVEFASNVPPLAWPVNGLSAVSGNADAVITSPVFAYRLTIYSGTGTWKFQAIQAGVRN